MRVFTTILMCFLMFVVYYHDCQADPSHVLWTMLSFFGTIGLIGWVIVNLIEESKQ